MVSVGDRAPRPGDVSPLLTQLSRFRRVHLSSGRTPQVVSPIGLDLKLLKRALKGPSKIPLE